MQQNVIDKFNAVTEESVEDYGKARDGGFRWMWFLQRARQKVVESGYLPQQGYLLFDARYIDSAPHVLDGLIGSVRSVENPKMRVTKTLPWEKTDIEQWKQSALSFSAMMFDAGCIAACTWGFEEGFDPLKENAPAAVFGDVGFLGMRGKSLEFLRTLVGENAADLAAEIGDCACSHLYADKNIVERAFKEPVKLREAYFRGVCAAAYIAGATFAKLLAQQG